jgi:hypothetical protein
VATITGRDAGGVGRGARAHRRSHAPPSPTDELLWPEDLLPAVSATEGPPWSVVPPPAEELLWPDPPGATLPDTATPSEAATSPEAALLPHDEPAAPSVVTFAPDAELLWPDHTRVEVAIDDAGVVVGPPAAPAAPTAPAEAVTRLGDLERVLRILAATTAVGLLFGFLVGGIGGRVAMRLLFLTSGAQVRGMISDDGFPIGRFDLGATLNLLVVGTVLGVLGAFVYLAVRPFLLGPPWLRTLGCAVGAGAVVGSMLVHVEGVDFTRLGPRWFAIALFVALPALFGALVPGAVERALRPDGRFLTGRRRLALLPLAAFAFPPLLLLVGPPVALVLAVRRFARGRPAVHRALTHVWTLHGVRVAWVSVGLVGVWTLGADSVELLFHA